MIFNSFDEATPYAKGILRLAPIREDKETAAIRIDNITLGYQVDSSVTASTTGTYYVNKGTVSEPLYYPVVLPAGYVSGTTYYTFNSSVSDLIEPIQDITDICGINPSEISYSKNTMSSENSGRVLENLNMVKDILGRVWDIKLNFSVLSMERLQSLDDYLMNKTQTFQVTEGQETKDITRYVIWYYAEIRLPNGVIKDVFYVGDSSFNDIGTIYKVVEDNDGLSTEPYAKDVKVNLIGKSSIGGIRNSDYSIQS